MQPRRFDVVLGNAALDLAKAPDAYMRQISLLAPNAIFYLPINFSGVTEFQEKETNISSSGSVVQSYHQSMVEGGHVSDAQVFLLRQPKLTTSVRLEMMLIIVSE